MKPDHLAILAEVAKEAQFKAGDVLFREGGPASQYLIESGKIALEAHPLSSHSRRDMAWRFISIGPPKKSCSFKCARMNFCNSPGRHQHDVSVGDNAMGDRLGRFVEKLPEPVRVSMTASWR
jgi:hypothetical protein